MLKPEMAQEKGRGKGTPRDASKLPLVPEEPTMAVEPKVEEEEDEDEDMGDGKEEPAEAAKKIGKRKMSLRILGTALMAPQEAQEEPMMAQEALAWGLLWWLELEKAKAAKKACKG